MQDVTNPVIFSYFYCMFSTPVLLDSYVKLLHFSRDRSNWSSRCFYSNTIHILPVIYYQLSEAEISDDLLQGLAAWPKGYFHRYCAGEAVWNKEPPTRETQAVGHKRQAVKQTDRQTERETDRQRDRLGSSQSRCGGLGNYKISRTYSESTKNSYIT